MPCHLLEILIKQISVKDPKCIVVTSITGEFEDSQVWEPVGYPTLSKEIIRDALQGLNYFKTRPKEAENGTEISSKT